MESLVCMFLSFVGAVVGCIFGNFIVEEYYDNTLDEEEEER